MWKRILRLLTAFFSLYSFYQNPVRFLLGLAAVILIPYLVYVFWGVIILAFLIGLSIFAFYKLLTNNKKRRSNVGGA